MIVEELLEYMSLETVERLIKDFGGDMIYIPIQKNLNLYKLFKNLKTDIKTMSPSEIAQKYNVSARTVNNYAKKMHIWR